MNVQSLTGAAPTGVAGSPPPMPVPGQVRVFGILHVVVAILGLLGPLITCVYPVLALVLLNRRSVKVALGMGA